MNSLRLILFLILSVLFAGSAVQADSDSRISQLERTVQQLQERISQLEAGMIRNGQRNSVVDTNSSNDIRNWRRLRKDMTEKEVEQLLGSAGKVDVTSFSIYWYYDYPNGGKVVFSAQSRHLEQWSEPSSR